MYMTDTLLDAQSEDGFAFNTGEYSSQIQMTLVAYL